jgi:hypothetical protein
LKSMSPGDLITPRGSHNSRSDSISQYKCQFHNKVLSDEKRKQRSSNCECPGKATMITDEEGYVILVELYAHNHDYGHDEHCRDLENKKKKKLKSC